MPTLRPLLAAATAAVLAATALADKPAERMAELKVFDHLRTAYQDRLEEIVKGLAKDHADLARWCAKAGLATEAAAEQARASMLDPAQPGAPAGLAPAPAPDPKAAPELPKKRKSLAQGLARRYIDLANWCKKTGMELEFRRTIRKLVRLVPEHADVRKFLGQHKYQGEWLTFEQVQGRKGLEFYRRKWLPEPQYAKTRTADLEKERQRLSKQYKLDFKATYTPHLDVFYTVSEERVKEDLPVLTAFFGKVHPAIFTGEFKQPFQFWYVKGEDQFSRIGQRPGALGVYSNGVLYSYEGAKGTGTYVHELTHGLVDISFKKGAPGWFNEGLASFFESFLTRPAGTGKLEFTFGYINERQSVLLEALRSGKMQHLRDFVRRTDGEASDLDYAHGRALFCFLFEKGLLDTFLLRVQLEEGKKTIPEHLEETLLQPIDAIHEEFVKFARANEKVWTLLEPTPLADDTVDAKVPFEEYASWGR